MSPLRMASFLSLALLVLISPVMNATVSAAGGTPKAVAENVKYHLGDIEMPEEFKHTFVIRNEGDSPLELRRGPSTCSCTITQLSDEPVPPGGKAEIKVGFSEAALKKKDTLKNGDFDRGVTVLTNDPGRPSILFGLYATAKSGLAADPEGIALLLHLSDLSSEDKRTIRTTLYSQTLDQFDLEERGKSLQGIIWRSLPADEKKLKSLGAKSGRLVEITLPEELPDGRFAEWIDFAVPAKEGDRQRTVQVQINGRVDGRLSFYNANLDERKILRLGTIKEGETRREKVLMKIDDDHKKIDVKRIETEPAFLHAIVAPYKKDAPEKGLYRIELEIPRDAPACSRMGDFCGKIRIETDHPKLSVIELKVDFAVLSASTENAVAGR